MKHECNVARDLMPLMLDGAASEESQKLLREHLEECEACRAYYAGMQAALPVARKANNKQEQKAFDEAARKVRKKRRRRLWRKILIGVLIGMVLMYGGLRTWSELTQRYNTPVYPGEYGVYLSQLADGSVSVDIDFQGSFRDTAVEIDEEHDGDKRVLYVYMKTTRIPLNTQHFNQNYSCMRLTPGKMNELAEIREGTPDEYQVVWRAGGSIPAASEEMERYFELLDQIKLIPFKEIDYGKIAPISFEDRQRNEALHEQLFTVKNTVPEWQ